VPLQDAADDLGHRINNIRSDEFLVYVEKENRRQEIAVLGTAYRFARFFATLEMLYDRAEFLSLKRRSAGESRRQPVLQTLDEIGGTFAKRRVRLGGCAGLPIGEVHDLARGAARDG
jgi:hypothetical protein